MSQKSNYNLNSARQEKNDEFYTLYEDIENECSHYIKHFKDKVIYCNCDNPLFSNFVKYFILNFNNLGLRKFICTCYSRTKYALWNNTESSYNNTNTSLDEAYKIVLPDCVENYEKYSSQEIYDLLIDDIKSEKFLYVKKLQDDGDFRSDECQKILNQSDIVVTNPPFSLFKDLISLLEKYKKHYLLIGNKNAITYKEVYPRIKDNALWLGYTYPEKFIQPEGDVKKVMSGLTRWFTNLDTNKKSEPLTLIKKYNPELYPKYDLFNAIVVDKTQNIPVDYFGAMGVPITFLDKYNPDQFELVTFRKDAQGRQLIFSREMEKEFNSTFISPYDNNSTFADVRKNAYISSRDLEPIDYFFPCVNFIWGVLTNNNETLVNGKNIYKHILIRRKSKGGEVFIDSSPSTESELW